MKNCEQDISLYSNCPNPVRMKQNSTTAMEEIHYEENHDVSVGRSEMDIIFPLQPGRHRMPFIPNNRCTDHDLFVQKDKNSLDSPTEHLQNSKQSSNRRRGKYDQCQKEHFDTDFSDIPRERGETNSKLLSGYKISHKRRLYENEIRLKKEIHKKEILLQEKLLKAVETLRKVQIGSASEDKIKKEQRNTGQSESRFYYTEKGNWDWESARDRTVGGRRREGQQEEFNILFKGNDGMKREEHFLKDTHVHQKEKTNHQRTAKTAEMEFDSFEKMTRHMRQSDRTEKDGAKRERVVERRRDEMRKWDQSDWQEKEIVRAYDGEKRRREQAKVKKDAEKEDPDQRWNIMEKVASNSPINGKGVFNNSKRDVLMKKQSDTRDRVHQDNNRAAEEMLRKQPLPEDGPRLPNIKEKLMAEVDFQLLPCEVCHRTFKVDRLEKHISICQKTTTSKCKVYDSAQHRMKGTEIEEFLKKNGRSKTPEPKKSKKQGAFIQKHQPRGPATRGVQPRANPRLTPGKAETHIPKCQNIKSKAPPPRQRLHM